MLTFKIKKKNTAIGNFIEYLPKTVYGTCISNWLYFQK